MMFNVLADFIREQYGGSSAIPLHAPVFAGREQQYLIQTIESTYVSSVGEFVDRFELMLASYTGSPAAVAAVNGTAALHVALRLAGVVPGDLVITQPVTFVATCNAIAYCGAEPVFVDVDRRTLGLSPRAMESWLGENARVEDGLCRMKTGGRVIRACVPMHTFGHPADLDGLVNVCRRWCLTMVEDAAESLGSLYKGRHTGTFGLLGVLSFNGNKIVTTGGGGMILAGAALAGRAKHLTTTARVPGRAEHAHDELGYNYRMPNLNAALGCAQMELLERFVESKRRLAAGYEEILRGASLQFVGEPPDCRSNYWLNAVICEDRPQRDAVLKYTNELGIMTRPLWALMSTLPMYVGAPRGDLTNSSWLADRVVNLPSSVTPGFTP